MDDQPAKIIYILGGGHSGSTLLDLILGSTPQSFSVGELMYVDFYKGYKTAKSFRLVKGRLCTCGDHFDECAFWSNVKFEGADNVAKHESFSESIRILFNIMNPFERWMRAKFQLSPNRDVYGRILNQARQFKSQVRYIVDSSKDPRRLYELLNDPDIGPEKLAIIHLIRDGRGYIYSYQKPQRLEGGRELRSTLPCLFEWIVVNIISRRIIRKYNLNAFTLSYDRFAENPDEYLGRLGRYLGFDLETEPALKAIEQTVYHNVHGNPIRRRRIEAIRRDTAWQSFFSPIKKFLLTVVLYPFNRRWVYSRD
jgi:hypothetical protein